MSSPSAWSQLRLATPRLLLRPLADGDAQALYAIFSDPRVMRFWSSEPWATLDRAHQHIALRRAELERGEDPCLAIERVADAALIGTCTLFHHVPQCRRAELGYGLAVSAWGQGYVQEAVSRLLAWGFDEMGLNRVEADIDPRNVASARSLERLGLRREGLLRERWIVGDEVSDTALYGLLRADWLQRDPPDASGAR
jgi:RimJ/RimL family protein N-acetyltransferase